MHTHTDHGIEFDTDIVNIICMKWGTLYGAEDVNNLYRGVARNLKRPFRFVCLTDDSDGFLPEIEEQPIPVLDLPEGNHDTRWNKLALFQSELGDLKGPSLFLDLDLVIVGNLDIFFELPGEVVIIRDDDLFRGKPLRKLTPERDRFLHMVGNTSVFRFEVGAHTDILRTYLSDTDNMTEKYEHEQQMVSDVLDRQGKLSYWPKDLCVSFKNHCVGRGLASYVRDPICPQNARIVLFAGAPKLSEVMSGQGSKWYRRIRCPEWLQQAWNGS